MNEYLLTNNKGLALVVSSFGAGVRSLSLNGKKLILELNREQDYQDSPMYFGKTLGRVCGRTNKTLNIDGSTFDVLADENDIALHGGESLSFSYKDFQPSLNATRNNKSVTFSYLSKDLENGYPGNLKVDVTYTLNNNENIFTISFKAKTDKPTFVNLTNHIYWAINEEGLDSQFLYIDASNISSFEAGTLLIDGQRSVSDEYDFTTLSSLKEKLDRIVSDDDSLKTIDHTYIFNGIKSDIARVILTDKKIKVSCYTDYDSTNIYTDLTCNPVSFANGKDFYTKDRRAIAIEPQKFIKGDLLLRPDEEYNKFITYKIEEVM